MILSLSASCMQGSYEYLSSEVSDSETEDARRRIRNNIRDRNLTGSSDYCRESEDCKEVCDSMYLKATDLDRCYNTREYQVDAAADVFDVLITPRRLSDLNDIDEKGFSEFLNIGYRGFLDLIDPTHIDEDGDRRNRRDRNRGDRYAYDSDTAELVLEWLAEEEKISKSVQSKDKEDEILRHLVCLVGQEKCSEISRQLCSTERYPHTNVIIRDLCPNGRISTNTAVTSLIGKCDDNHACHDNTLPFLLGLTSDVFDDVTLHTYANAQDNDGVTAALDDLIKKECSNAEDCKKGFYCLISHIEGKSSVNGYSWSDGVDTAKSCKNGGGVDCKRFYCSVMKSTDLYNIETGSGTYNVWSSCNDIGNFKGIQEVIEDKCNSKYECNPSCIKDSYCSVFEFIGIPFHVGFSSSYDNRYNNSKCGS